DPGRGSPFRTPGVKRGDRAAPRRPARPSRPPDGRVRRPASHPPMPRDQGFPAGVSNVSSKFSKFTGKRTNWNGSGPGSRQPTAVLPLPPAEERAVRPAARRPYMRKEWRHGAMGDVVADHRRVGAGAGLNAGLRFRMVAGPRARARYSSDHAL